MSQAGSRCRTGVLLVLSVLIGALTATPAEGANPKAGNGKIAFTRTGDGRNNVWVMNADGSGQVRLTDTQQAFDPAHSPNGRQIAFARADAGQFDLWLMNADGGGQRNLTNTGGSPAVFEQDPAYSPDGKQIAFSRIVNGRGDIWLMNADGGGQLSLTNTPNLSETAPDFSADGRRIVFARTDAGGQDIWTMNADGGGQLNLTNTPASASNEGEPAFSSDGRIGFHRCDNSFFQVCVIVIINTNGAEATLDPTTNSDADPAFSPDTKRIAFDTGVFVISSIAVMNSDGSNPVQVTNGADSGPKWEYVYRCAGRRATIVGDDGPDRIKGTKGKDVIVSNGGNDKVKGRGGRDRICLGKGRDKASGGGGNDKCIGGQGKDRGSCERGKL